VEPHISMSLLYCVSSLFYLCICFCFILYDPVFLTNKTLLSACAKLELGGYEKEQIFVNYLEKVLEILIFLSNKIFGLGVTRVSIFWLLWTMVGRRWMIIVFFSEYDLNNILLDILLWK
jgi:hypothetical protein